MESSGTDDPGTSALGDWTDMPNIGWTLDILDSQNPLTESLFLVETEDVDCGQLFLEPWSSLPQEESSATAPPLFQTSSSLPTSLAGDANDFEHWDSLLTDVSDRCSNLPQTCPSQGTERPTITNNVSAGNWVSEKTPPKIGKRFASGPSRILKTWFAQNISRPYPTVQDIELMQRQTGLTRQQIVTWFRNARRQRKTQVKSQAPRPPTPVPRRIQPTMPNNIQKLPLSLQDLNPLQRWQNSPPEHESATTTAIVRAMSSFQRPKGMSTPIDDGASAASWRDDSSASSAATSRLSNSSLGSAWSDESWLPSTSLDHRRRNKRRRRRHDLYQTQLDGYNSLNAECHTYQCTFCTETFKTKHNWQRHEKSLHLSLEQWECSPQGPIFLDSEGKVTCVYCGLVNPDHDHLMVHNFAACHERSKEERIYYRKDHLQQHLKLVHEAQFMKGPMEEWRHDMQAIRSRCGFCDLVMDAWADRVDHLGDHFKHGKAMADWKGSWGFDNHILAMVENSMPPYLIHYERNSPWPFTTQQGPVETPVSAFELIKLELDYWMHQKNARGGSPSTQELQFESCCVILGSEIFSAQPGHPGTSWLRDLLMSSPEITRRARLCPTTSSLRTRITKLKIHGKGNIFENCSAEAQLRQFVERFAGEVIGDVELQVEASRIISSMESASSKPSAIIMRFLNDLIFSSSLWLALFRRRANLDGQGSALRLASTSKPLEQCRPSVPAATEPSRGNQDMGRIMGEAESQAMEDSISSYFQDDNNCYRRLTRELSRYVASAMSHRNPARHVPSDEELQHQARWIMFGDDDPWNQTPADNPNWLQDFKRTIGLTAAR